MLSLSLCLPVFLFLSFCLSVSLSLCLSSILITWGVNVVFVCLSVCPSVCVNLCVAVWKRLCLPSFASVSLSVSGLFPFISLCRCLIPSLRIFRHAFSCDSFQVPTVRDKIRGWQIPNRSHPWMADTKSVSSGAARYQIGLIRTCRFKISFICVWQRPSQPHPGLTETKSASSLYILIYPYISL